MAQLEIACFNLESALIAQQNGADRVELCDGIEVGGTTPNREVVESARKNLDIDLYVMIRPRGGNFVYAESEFHQMKSEILTMKNLNVDGFVFGVLTNDNKVDVEANKFLIEAAKPLPCTLHRAFDEVDDYGQALEDSIGCGFKTILTSGQKQDVTDGVEKLSKLVEKANNRITIMPGGGLRSSNIDFIQKETNAVFYHSSAITDGSETAVAEEIMALKSKLK